MHPANFLVIDIFRVVRTCFGIVPLSRECAASGLTFEGERFLDADGKSDRLTRVGELVSHATMTREELECLRIREMAQSQVVVQTDDCGFSPALCAPFIVHDGVAQEVVRRRGVIELQIRALSETADFIATMDSFQSVPPILEDMHSRDAGIQSWFRAAEKLPFQTGLWIPFEWGEQPIHGVIHLDEQIAASRFRCEFFLIPEQCSLAPGEVLRRHVVWQRFRRTEDHHREVTIGKVSELTPL